VPKRESAAVRELREGLFTNIKQYRGSLGPGQWFEATTRHGDRVVLLRQAPNLWHWFLGEAEVAGSGEDPFHAIDSRQLGGIVEPKSGQMRQLRFMVNMAPPDLAGRYMGLRWAQERC
jgi:hypothetical protein